MNSEPGTRFVPESRTSPAAARDSWPPGKILLDEYTIREVLGRGGMGTVYRVERVLSSRILQFAVKTLRPELLENSHRRSAFLRELRTWMDLPDHPNLVSCCFFKTIESHLAVFADYIPGCSLHALIRRREILDLPRILDIALQLAWGLECAHASGVIHQDVKPSNVLVDPSGTVKVTDFGLARSRPRAASTGTAPESEDTRYIQSGGMTLAYCSPEQAMGDKISHRTDIWSYGVTLLEMFTGPATWRFGGLAPVILERLRDHGPPDPYPPIPDPVADLLHTCFESDPRDRWPGMADISRALLAMIPRITGAACRRSAPEFPRDVHVICTAPERNTFDGGTWKDPDPFLHRAIHASDHPQDLAPDPEDQEAHTSRKSQVLLDLEKYETTRILFQNLVQAGHSRHIPDLIAVNFNTALVHEAGGDFHGAMALYREAIRWYPHLDPEQIDKSIMIYLADSHMNLATCLFHTDIPTAIHHLDRAIEVYESLQKSHGGPGIDAFLSHACMNKALVLCSIHQYRQALPVMKRARNLADSAARADRSDDHLSSLGFTTLNLAQVFYNLGRMKQAHRLILQATDLFEDLLYRKNLYETVTCLSSTHIHHALILTDFNRIDEAMAELERSIRMLHYHINTEDRQELKSFLAEVLICRGQLLFLMRRPVAATSETRRAYRLMNDLTLLEGHSEQLRDFLKISLTFALVSMTTDQANPADIENCLLLWKQFINDHGPDAAAIPFLSAIYFILRYTPKYRPDLTGTVRTTIQSLLEKLDVPAMTQRVTDGIDAG